MKVLFGYCSTPSKLFHAQYHQGIGYLSSMLKAHGHKTDCILLEKMETKKLTSKLEEFKPDLIAMTLTSDNFNTAKDCASFIHKKFSLPVVLGGPHPTVSPDDSINLEGVIGICRGEGEYPLLELVQALQDGNDYTKIKNFWFKKDNQIIKNPRRQKVVEINDLPMPDRKVQENFIDFEIAEIMASRGCPFNCTYCINSFYHQLYKGEGKAVINRSVDNVLEEIDQLQKNYKPKLLIFHDDTFTLNLTWLSEFATKYPKRFNIPIQVNGQPQTITQELIDLLKKALVKEVKIGVESGNEELRKLVLNRKMTNEHIINAANLLHKNGLGVGTFNMIGLPGETEENIIETIELNKLLKPLFTVGCSIFKPYLGTPLYQKCMKEGLISTRKTESYFDEKSILNLDKLNQKTLSYYSRTFKLEINPRWDLPLVRILAKNSLLYHSYASSRRLARHIKAALKKRFV